MCATVFVCNEGLLLIFKVSSILIFRYSGWSVGSFTTCLMCFLPLLFCCSCRRVQISAVTLVCAMLRKIMAKTSFRETTRILLLSSDLDLASVMCLLIQAAAQRDDLICDGALGFVFLQTLQPKKFSCICSCDGGAEFSCERPKLKDWACKKTDPLQNHWKLDARRGS